MALPIDHWKPPLGEIASSAEIKSDNFSSLGISAVGTTNGSPRDQINDLAGDNSI
jgi:hypothetical protein